MVEHDYAAATRALAASPRDDFQEVDFTFYYPRPGTKRSLRGPGGDQETAHAKFAAARKILEEPPNHEARGCAHHRGPGASRCGSWRQGSGDQGSAACGRPDAGLSRDAYDGALVLQGLAQVYTWTGEKDKALDRRAPADADAGLSDLWISKVDPSWDPLRGDPRFEQFVASLAPAKK